MCGVFYHVNLTTTANTHPNTVSPLLDKKDAQMTNGEAALDGHRNCIIEH